MEDFSFSQANERSEHSNNSALQAEWLESRVPAASAASSRVELVFADITNEKQEDGKEKVGDANSDQAGRLDRELKDFANSKFENTSHNMDSFQKAVGRFCDAEDKDAALDDLGDTWSRISKLMDVGVEALYKEIKAEAARQPGRKELEADYKKMQNAFADRMISLPFSEYTRIHELMDWKDSETKAEHRDRIRAGMANNKKLLDAYNAREAAEDAIEANKSPREKEMEFLSKQIYSDAKIIKAQLEKAYIRSTLKN